MSVMYICIELDTSNKNVGIDVDSMLSELSMGRLDQARTRPELENNLKLQMTPKKPEQFCRYMEKGPISIFSKLVFFRILHCFYIFYHV